ncbi:hypothetical protein F5148DRAFT_1288535 [Russula earlei]|uniref:Uncharacterized protein n=1 Tax=Russula earlei TaxID=71964 RepID=A0ACC0U1S9_9AGAM|nr:hypothetical protein F5148DRAFT_1288535 [Russula earlei]
MSVFEADYSNLFAAGLRVIQSKSKGRRSSPDSPLCSPVPSSTATTEHDQGLTPSSGPSSSWRTFHFPTRLWRRTSPRNDKRSSAGPDLTTAKEAESKHARRRSMPNGIGEESVLDVRIWRARVSNAIPFVEEDECVDPFLENIKLPGSASLCEFDLTPLHPLSSPWRSQHDGDGRVFEQALPLHLKLPTHSYHSFLDWEEETVWESASASDR